jgi:hypothetical protein
MAEGTGCHYLIDASFDQVRVEFIAIPPMVLVLETEAAAPGIRLGSFQGFVYAEVPLNREGAIAGMLKVAYQQIADRTFIDASMREMESLRPAIDLICERITKVDG